LIARERRNVRALKADVSSRRAMGIEAMIAQTELIRSSAISENFFERGLAFSIGRDGQVDLVEAHKWFNIAAARGDRVAARHREELAGEMSREQIAAALRAAREWISCH
jgi:hypothetical protein